MTDKCLFCHQPVDDDIKLLTKVNNQGHVVTAVCHKSCYERVMGKRKVSPYMEVRP